MFTLKFECGPVPADRCSMARRTPVQTWRDLSGEVCAFGYAGDGWWEMEWPRIGVFRFGPALHQTVRVIPEAGADPQRVQEVYRRSVLPLMWQALGDETIHASAVTGSRGVLAFCGERGAGKSTVAYGLCRRGFPQHADDTLVLSVTPGKVTTRPLPFIPRLRKPSADFFRTAGFLDSSVTVQARPSQLAAVFVLRQTEDTDSPTITRLEPHAAFRDVLAHAHSFEPENPESRRRLLQNYLELSATVPVFDVRYVPGLDRLDPLLDALVTAAGESTPATRCA